MNKKIAKLELGIPKWREPAQAKLKQLIDEVKGTAPREFTDSLKGALKIASSRNKAR